jgi:hypothetical protein
MKVKTYGVPGLNEWHGKVKAGSLEVSVSFTGGTSSPSGAQPAYFMTKDPIVQFIIENCREYKEGFIILVMSQDVPGEHPRMALPKEPAKDVPTGSEPPSSGSEASDGDTGEVNVADKSEAIEWLKEHFPEKGYTATGLRTVSAFEAACKENGVKFIFTS